MAGSSKKAVVTALAGNFLIALMKFASAFFTGSSAMLSEGVHSLADTSNQLLLLHGMRRSRQQPSPEHPFGYGKEVFFWGFVVAILVFAVGAGVSLYEGIRHLVHPKVLEHSFSSYIILGAAILIEGYTFYVAYQSLPRKQGASLLSSIRQSKDPASFVILLEDAAALCGLLLALTGILLADATGSPLYDALASVGIGLLLAATAFLMAAETKGLLIGESADPELVGAIRQVAGASPNVTCVNEILTMQVGPDRILLNLSVHFADHLDGAGVRQAVNDMEAAIRARIPQAYRIFIEDESREDVASNPRAATTCEMTVNGK